MTVFDILSDTDLVSDNVKIRIKDTEAAPIATGSWYDDQILNYQDSEVQSFNYDVHANRLTIILREVFRKW